MKPKNFFILLFIITSILKTSIFANDYLTEHVVLTNFDNACSIAGIDLDGDGDTDIVATSFDGNYIAWLENDGNQNFTKHVIIENFGNARVLDVAHIDSDDDYDIVATAGSDEKISWFENDGIGNFTEHVIVENWESAGFVMARDHFNNIDLDIDLDGDTDLLASATAPGDRISWFENDGAENFTEHIIKDNWYWARYSTANDIDKDGDIDIIGTAKAGEVIWFENDGNEKFSENIIISDWGEPSSVQAADIDKDGDIDLAATSVRANEVVWFENDGNHVFTKHLIKDHYNGAFSVTIADIDFDDDYDILAIAWIGAFITVYENDGNENFTEYVFCESAFDMIKIFPVDLDGDKDTDILGACYSNDDIRWWENDLNKFQFQADQISGHVPLTVQFTDSSITSPPIISWSWDFDNDKTFDSQEQNPSWTYEQPGIYSVKLEVTNSSYENTMVRENYIHAIGEESALYFDGENSYLTCAASSALNLTGEFTIEAWINPTDNGVDPGLNMPNIFDKSKILIYFIYSHPYYNKKSICLKMKHADGTTSRVLSPENSVKLEEWQHIAVTFNADSIVKMYFDGIEQELDIKKQPTGTIENNSDEDLIIGSSPNYSSTFDGTIDEVRFWNCVRSAEEVQSEMNRCLNNNVPNLVGYWKMDEGSGETTKEEISNENSSVLTGTQWRVGVSLSQPTSVRRGELFQEIPTDYILYPNYPNPFNPFTTISFNLPEVSLLNLFIFDINGRFVKSLINQTVYEAGFHTVGWDGTDNTCKKVSSGVYFYKINADTFSDIKKMLFIK